jgi:preprotein translocase subunit SecY
MFRNRQNKVMENILDLNMEKDEEINMEEIKRIAMSKGFSNHEERRFYYPLLLNVSLKDPPEFPFEIVDYICYPQLYGNDSIYEYLAPTAAIRNQIYLGFFFFFFFFFLCIFFFTYIVRRCTFTSRV